MSKTNVCFNYSHVRQHLLLHDSFGLFGGRSRNCSGVGKHVMNVCQSCCRLVFSICVVHFYSTQMMELDRNNSSLILYLIQTSRRPEWVLNEFVSRQWLSFKGDFGQSISSYHNSQEHFIFLWNDQRKWLSEWLRSLVCQFRQTVSLPILNSQ